jgi:hypothetical protein
VSALSRVRAEAGGEADEARRWQLLADAEHAMIIPPRFATYPKCEDAIWRSVQRAMTGEWTPRDAVRKAAEAIRPIVAATGTHAVVES